jgi:hypothetical protein
MKKTLLLVLILSSITAFSQTTAKQPKKRISDLGISLGTSLDNLGGLSSGVDIRFIPVSTQKISWTVTPGFTYFNKRNGGFIVLKSGVLLPITDRFYLSGETGIGFFTEGGESFILSPGIGTNSKNLNFSLRYERFSSYTSQLAFRLGISL